MKITMLGNNTKKEIEKRVQIVASAGNLSRANGTVTDVLNGHTDFEANVKLARAVVGYGHRSISEHDYLVFALENVTPIIEQTIISYRLTSFTIKSRRNVDFRNVGFYVPDFKDKNGVVLKDNKKIQSEYKKYMKSLFSKYGELVDMELPVEDCRYILPYSYYSNIIMGLDANELLRMTSDMLYGKISHITEVNEFGKILANIINKYVPYLSKALEKEKEKSCYEDKYDYLDEYVENDNKLLKEACLTNYTKDADEIVLRNILVSRYHIPYKDTKKILDDLVKKNENIKDRMIKSLIASKSQRELEQVIYSFETPISLAVLTHITRHRMHSLLIPDFVPLWNVGNYVIPDSIKNKCEKVFRKIFSDNKKMLERFKSYGVRDEDLIYFYLSGNACNISTTMNGRVLEWVSRMRCCNKAQWEIRNIMNKVVADVKKVTPLVGKCLGPTCIVEGYCPEGKDSCKNRGVVIIRNDKKA